MASVTRLSLLAWRSVASRRARSLLTIAGIALGVGVLFAAMATNAGIDASIDRTVHQMLGRADLRVAAFGEAGLGADSVTAIERTAGVAVAAPQLERRTYLEAPPGRARDGFADAVSILGIDPPTDSRLHDLAIASGRSLASNQDTGALITERLARATSLGLGDQLTILGSATGGPLTLPISGILADDGPLVDAGGRTVIVSLATAQQLFSTDRVTNVDVELAPGASTDGVVAQLQQRLTFDPFVVSGPADLAASLRSSAIDFRSLTALIAAISLFVGAFLIFNTLSMTVVERVRDVGLLRAAGTTARQVNLLILQQALVLGIAGSLLGLALGIVLAAAVAAYVRSVDAIPLGGLDVPLGGVALAVLLGIAVTLAAALEPAYRAGRITPVEALKARIDPTVSLRARLRWLVVVFVVVAVAGLLIWPAGAGTEQLARSFAVFGILLVGTLVTPFLLGPLGRLAGLPFAAILPAEERLTRGALVRDRSRTALTVGALTIGLAMIVAVGGLGQNAHRSASDWLANVVPGDEVVTSIRPVPLDEGLQDELAAVNNVARVTPVATFAVAYEGVRLDAAAIVGADFAADGRLTFVSGDRRSALAGLDAGGTVILPQAMADRLGLRVGDRMSLLGGNAKPIELRVTGTVEHGLPGAAGETLFVGWSDATNGLGVVGADFFAVRFVPGQAASARPALEDAARQLALEPNSIDRVEGAISNALGQVFGLFDGLGVLAVLMAGLGIVNTLSMNVLERVREIGILRATGMTRRQVARMVLVEAAILGVIGAVIGSVTGVAAAFAMVGLSGGQPAAGFDVPWATIVLAAAFGIVVAVVASYQPARLASHVSIVRAVQFE